MKMKQMKLDGALKLYMVLYFIAFLFTFMMSVPMLKHVVPQGKCLLFVAETNKLGKQSFTYGSPGGCYAAGLLPLAVALGSLALLFLQWLQLRKLHQHLSNPQTSSDEYRAEARHTFWQMIWVHCGMGSLVLVIAFILTAGYSITCRNMSLVVDRELRSHVQHVPTTNQGQRSKAYEQFAGDAQINRYNSANTNFLGQSVGEQSITCRKLLTDPQNTFRLLENHMKDNQAIAQYYGFWNSGTSGSQPSFSDVGNFNTITFEDNLTLEVSLAGAWISVFFWLVILLLMVRERHHLRAHLTDESMWAGSDHGSVKAGSVRSARKISTNSQHRSLMTPVDFDVQSNMSRASKASRSSKGTSYKDMGGSRAGRGGGGSSYKDMGATKQQGRQGEAAPSRLTVSRLEQVPSLPPSYGVKKLLSGRGGQDDTLGSSVTGAVIGPSARPSILPTSPLMNPPSGGLMDYFGSPQTMGPGGSSAESEEL